MSPADRRLLILCAAAIVVASAGALFFLAEAAARVVLVFDTAVGLLALLVAWSSEPTDPDGVIDGMFAHDRTPCLELYC